MNKSLQENVTILIKTFNRKWSLLKLLGSLAKLNCKLPILIADDSQEPYKDEILGCFPNLDVQYIILPFDTGLSAGRNALLMQVKTPYFLLCDDDFVFDAKTKISKVLTAIEKYNLDVAGGILLNHINVIGIKRFFRVMSTPRMLFRVIFNIPSVSRHYGHFSVQNSSCILTISNQKPLTSVHFCDLVNNFFIAKTNSVLRIKGWDESFKVGEHEDFFYRAKLTGLKVGLVHDLCAKHYPCARADYLSFRERAFELKKRFVLKFLFTEYTEINKDNNKVLYLYRAIEMNDSSAK